MIVTVIAVRMMQVTVDEIVNVISMRHSLMTATRTVDVIRIVATAGVGGGASVRVGVTHFHHVLFHLAILTNVMKVPVVQVVDVVAVLNAGVLAVGSVLVIVVFVTIAHRLSPHGEKFPSRA